MAGVPRTAADGSRRPAFRANGSDNTEGYHGNGIVASLPHGRPDRDPPRRRGGLVCARPHAAQRRIGNRMAIAADFGTAGCASSPVRCIWRTAPTAPAARAQMRTLLDALDAYAGTIAGGDRRRPEHACRPGRLRTTRRSRCSHWRRRAATIGRRAIWRDRRRAPAPGAGAKARASSTGSARAACRVRDPEVVPALGEDGSVLSDHELHVADA